MPGVSLSALSQVILKLRKWQEIRLVGEEQTAGPGRSAVYQVVKKE